MIQIRPRRPIPLAVAALLIAGCNQQKDTPPAGDNDNTPGLTWPTAIAEYPAALQPTVTVTASGIVVLTYVKDGSLWLVKDPAAHPTALAIGDSVGELTEVRAATGPSSEQSFIVWEYARHVWANAGVAALPSGHLVDSWDVADLVSLAWTGAAPVVVMRSGDDVHAFPVLNGATSLLVPPTSASLLMTLPNAAAYFGETPTVIDRGGDRAVIFDPWGVEAGSAWGTNARWVVGKRDPLATGELAQYFAVESQGNFAIPGRSDTNRSWVQAHDLGSGAAVLTWAETVAGTGVFDVYLARLGFDADQKPSLASEAVNVSNTSGMTDNSDFPIVRRTSQGELWVAWREQNLGPRVALFDTNLALVDTASPSAELHCDDSQPISAALGPDDSLHLVAVTSPDGGSRGVQYWQIARH